MTPGQLVDACLDMIGPLSVSETTRRELVEHAASTGDLRFDGNGGDSSSTDQIKEMLQLIVATREYQMA